VAEIEGTILDLGIIKENNMTACGCGRSPNGLCIDWHNLSEEEYQIKLKDYNEISSLLIENYIKGAISGKSIEMRPSFDENASWFGYVGSELIQGPIQGLYEWHDNNGAAKDLKYEIVSIDIIGNIANVKIELDNWTGHQFTDLMNLIKLEGHWKVVNKVFYLHQ